MSDFIFLHEEDDAINMYLDNEWMEEEAREWDCDESYEEREEDNEE